MPAGVIFSLVAYFLYSCCDAIIKGFGSDLAVFEIAFWTALFSFLPVIFTKPKAERWVDFWHMHHPWLVNLRSISGVVGNMAIIYSFTHIALAEAYSIAFLAPIFVVFLSVRYLGEQVSWTRWLFLAATFLGVLLVVRPGFRELQLGHLTALLAAVAGAVTTTLLRKVAPFEKRVSLIGIPLAYTVVVNFFLMLPSFEWPTPEEFALLLSIGALGGTGNILFIAATRRTPVSRIAPGQYSQIAWAITFGAVFYAEFPDLIAWGGLAIVATFGIMNVMSDETRIRIFSRLSAGAGPATVTAEVQTPIGDPPRPKDD